MTTKTQELFATYAPLCGIVGPGLIGLGMVISGLTYIGVQGQAYAR